MTPAYRFFLGGHDLEMVEIGRLLAAAGLSDRVVDAGLAWGARASAHGEMIAASLAAGETPVLIELIDDLDPSIDRARLVNIDHHGDRAGHDQPTAIEQVHTLLGSAAPPWTRWWSLVAANDKGHAPALRALGATPEEVRAVRDADRVAQGVSPEWEAAARAALSRAKQRGALRVVDVDAPTSSPVMDFLLPEYGGPGAGDTVVLTTKAVNFFGRGAVIQALADEPGAWFGGDLPIAGYWGVATTDTHRRADLVRRIAQAAEHT